eukprot:Nk52_evm1s907 gene=Nk52_evmTU1s907
MEDTKQAVISAGKELGAECVSEDFKGKNIGKNSRAGSSRNDCHVRSTKKNAESLSFVSQGNKRGRLERRVCGNRKYTKRVVEMDSVVKRKKWLCNIKGHNKGPLAYLDRCFPYRLGGHGSVWKERQREVHTRGKRVAYKCVGSKRRALCFKKSAFNKWKVDSSARGQQSFNVCSKERLFQSVKGSECSVTENSRFINEKGFETNSVMDIN